MASSLHSIRFPNENTSYRKSRDQLLEAEMKLRKNIEEVAALRRKLPLGGEVREDYVFTQGAADLTDLRTEKKVHMSELFCQRTNTLLIYSYMYRLNMKEP